MSRQVDHMSGPLSDEDRAYLIERGRRHLVIQNDRMAEAGDFALPPEPEVNWDEEVRELNVPELKAELQARGLDTTGNKAELQARLIEAGPDED